MKTRDRRVKSVSQRKAQDKKGTQDISRSKRDRTTGTAHNGDTQGKSHTRVKRSGVEAVKLHLKATGDPGRTSRSATAVRICLFYSYCVEKFIYLVFYIRCRFVLLKLIRFLYVTNQVIVFKCFFIRY